MRKYISVSSEHISNVREQYYSKQYILKQTGKLNKSYKVIKNQIEQNCTIYGSIEYLHQLKIVIKL